MKQANKAHISVVLLVILLLSWALMMINIATPWWEQGSDNGAWISAAVRSYERYGFFEIGGLQVLNFEPATAENFEYYTHHPPIIVWSTALASAFFGFHELSFRYVAAVMTLISTVAMYVLSRRLVSHHQALWATGFYALTPMMLYFGRMPNHEAPALAFALLFLAVLVNASRKLTRTRIFALSLLAILCAWTAWAVLIFVGFGALWFLWRNPKKHWKVFLLLGVITVLSVVILLAYYQSQWDQAVPDLLDTFIWRTGNQQLDRSSAVFTWGEFLWKNFIHLVTLMTPSLLILNLIGIIFVVKYDKPATRGMVFVLLISALTYFLLFRNATFIHNYYKIYLSPAMALIASSAMVGWRVFAGRKGRAFSAAMGGLVVGAVITGAFLFNLLHLSADRPLMDSARASMEAHTQAGDTLYTNLDYGISPLSLYASVLMEGEKSPDDVIDLAETIESFIYMYCNLDEVENFELPQSLADFETVQDEDCFFVDMP